MKILVLILLSTACVYPFAYDSAISKAQKGNWKDAHSALSSIITDNPDRADVMYDAGVAAYNLGNKCQAATCFARAAECSTDKKIAFCAHFNAGNVYVDEKKLERALQEYDKALAIEPDNEYARHNRDRVKQMLEQEKQKNQDEKQDQDKDQQNKGDQNKDDAQDEKQDKQNQNNQSQNGNDKTDGQQDQSSSAKGTEDRQGQNGEQNQNGDDHQSENGNEKQNGSSESKLDKQTQGDREQQADAAKQRAQHGNNKEEKHQNASNDKQRNGNQELDKQSQDAQKEGAYQQGDKHNTPEKANGSEHNQINGSAGDGQELALNDPWLLKILNNQEMHDKAVNKQLMEAKIRQHGGKNGQNCW